MNREDRNSAVRFSAEVKRDGRDEKDDFWDVEMLLPNSHKAPRTAPRRAPGATDTAEITFGGENASRDGDVSDVPLNLNAGEDEIVVRHMIPPHVTPGDLPDPVGNEAPIADYEPKRSLVHHVTVYPWSSRYHYYRDFCRDAARYLSAEVEETPYVPFFSYVPQYSQMRRDQLRYYLYWRSELRRGNAIRTDDSYLYLYIYEIINTAGHETPAEEGLAMLYRLFFAFGRENARLARLLSEWIVDYSLIFRLGVPEEMHAAPDFHRLYLSALKEFYVTPTGEGASGYADLLLRFCTAYDYKKSHFYTGDNRAYFDRYLPGALSAVIAQYSEGTKLFSDTGMRDSHMVRNAFEQALASHRVRCRIEIDYASFSRSHEMRYLVSDILKYTENRLRAFLGVKSRLTVYSLSTDVKKCIDRYCDESFPRRPDHRERPKEIPAYEKLYDLPENALDLGHAREIELASWETTRRLTEAFSDGEPSPTEMSQTPLPEQKNEREAAPPAAIATETSVGSDEDASDLEALLGALYPFLEAAYREDFAAERTIADALGELPDVLADRVNELAADALGDILLEDTGTGYTVLPEYRTLFDRTNG